MHYITEQGKVHELFSLSLCLVKIPHHFCEHTKVILGDCFPLLKNVAKVCPTPYPLCQMKFAVSVTQLRTFSGTHWVAVGICLQTQTPVSYVGQLVQLTEAQGTMAHPTARMPMAKICYVICEIFYFIFWHIALQSKTEWVGEVRAQRWNVIISMMI